MDTTKIAIALRFFGSDPATAHLARARLRTFLDVASKFPKTYVAVHLAADVTGALTLIKDEYPDVHGFGIMPWQQFVAPGNALIYAAAHEGAQTLVFASAELPPRYEYVDALMSHLDKDTLFVGARLPEHAFSVGTHVRATGDAHPWNAFGIWNLRELAKFGMPLCGNTTLDEAETGTEELVTVALYQERYRTGMSNFKAHAKLVTIPHFCPQRNAHGWDSGSQQVHTEKNTSRILRPKARLEWAQLCAPTVMHIA